jgi:Ribonuclease G/E
LVTGRLLISALPGETRIARLDPDGGLLRLRILRDDRPGARGDVLLGRVSAVDGELGVAFVEIGLSRPGLLALKAGATPPREGESLVMRVTAAAQADKGAKLARAETAPPDEAKPPACLAHGDDPWTALLTEETPPDEIRIDDAAAYATAKARLADHPALRDRLALHAGPGPLFEADLEAQVDALLAPRVALAGGGFLLIEPVQSLTAIDVNSGGHRSRGGPARLAREVNLAAVPEIARQLRLRDLSGLIVIDFLDTPRRDERAALQAALQAALAEDPEPVRVFAPRPSGLTELTRRRARPPLHELLARRCGRDGGGWRRDPTALAFELLRRAAAAPASAVTRLCVSPAVAGALDGPAAAARAAVAARRGGRLVVVVEELRDDEACDIVLA